MSLRERATAWRDKHPDRASDLRTVMRRYLGMSLHDATASDFAKLAIEEAENELLGIVFGVPRDVVMAAAQVPGPSVPSSGERVPEQPERFSGRDAAAGAERE